MIGKIEISRELLQHVVDGGYCKSSVMEELRALLAAQVVERQEPVAEVLDMKYNCVKFYRATGDTSKPYLLPGTKLYTSPPAPVAVPVEIHQMLIEMRQKFERANFVALGKLLTACLDKVKELNQ